MPKKPEQVAQEPVEEREESPVKSIACPEFEVDRLYFRAQEPKEDATQLMCFPKYLYSDEDNDYELTPENFEKHSESAIIVTKPIKMVKGGIPKFNVKYHPEGENSMKRAYFYIPENKEDPNSMELFTLMNEIDDYMVSEINDKKNAGGIFCVLNKKKKKIALKGITYTRMVRAAKPFDDLDLDDDEEKKPKKEFVPWNRIRVNLSTVYDDKLGPNDLKDINTQVYVGDSEKPENCKTVSSVADHFMWQCTAQFALMFHKAWIKKGDQKECGIGIKCVQIGVTEQPEFNRSSVSKQLNKRLFANTGPLVKTSSAKKEDPEEDPEEDQEPEEPTTKKTKTTKNTTPVKNTKKPQPQPSPKKKQAKVESEEEEPEQEEEEEDEPEENDESEPESEESEEEPAPKTKKGSNKPPVKVKGKVVEKPSASSNKKPVPKKK